jgi:two-component system, response regulator FlrC
LPPVLQAKLLRALQEGEVLPVGAVKPVKVDVRIIAAANRDLAGEVEAGRFRADLYWRLNVMMLKLAPLRARRQDVRAITASLLIRHARNGYDFSWPTAHALDVLMAHDWPGNVRELDSVLQRALMIGEGWRIAVDDLSIERRTSIYDRDLKSVGRASQVSAIKTALEEVDGHRAKAAAALGVSERTLRYRLAEMRVAA